MLKEEESWTVLDILLIIAIITTLTMSITMPPQPPLVPPPYTMVNPSHYIQQDSAKPPTCDLIIHSCDKPYNCTSLSNPPPVLGLKFRSFSLIWI